MSVTLQEVQLGWGSPSRCQQQGWPGWSLLYFRVFLCIFLFASTLAQDDCLPNPNSPSCDDRDPANSTICQLTCDRVSTNCTQYDEAKCSQIGVDVTEESFTDMFATRCKEICEQSRDAEEPAKVCRFYKVSVSTHIA